MANGRSRSGGGLFTIVSLVVLIVAVVAVGIAAALLARTLAVAQNISLKAETIATTGRGINMATDSIVQLERTNAAAASILETAKPLEASLTTIVNHAGDINNSAGSINSTAGAINGVAGSINTSALAINVSATTINKNAGSILDSAKKINRVAKDIRSTASDILDVAYRIDQDAKDINNALDTTIAVALLIKGDTAVIVQEAVRARFLSSCIADKLYQPDPPPPNSVFTDHCDPGNPL